MSRYIDADALKEMIHYTDDFYETPYVEWEDIVLAPTVDAVQVVRCRDCKHRVVNEHYGEKGYIDLKAYCEFDTEDIFELGRHAADDDWFCADGERRTE